jgi:hypothetical protein
MLVANGKTIKMEETIANQGLKPGATIMILKINRKESSWSTAMVIFIKTPLTKSELA